VENLVSPQISYNDENLKTENFVEQPTQQRLSATIVQKTINLTTDIVLPQTQQPPYMVKREPKTIRNGLRRKKGDHAYFVEDSTETINLKLLRNNEILSNVRKKLRQSQLQNFQLRKKVDLLFAVVRQLSVHRDLSVNNDLFINNDLSENKDISVNKKLSISKYLSKKRVLSKKKDLFN